MDAENKPVDREEFAAAEARFNKTLWECRGAADRRDAADRVLRELQCRAEFTQGLEGPDGERDEYVIESACTLPVGHTGEHAEDYDLSDDAPDEYRRAVAVYRAEIDQALEKSAAWQDEEESLEALRCNNNDSDGGWPCVRRRGHEGEHEHPRLMNLVL